MRSARRTRLRGCPEWGLWRPGPGRRGWWTTSPKRRRRSFGARVTLSPISEIRVPQSARHDCHSLISTNTAPITREDPGSWEKKVHHGAPEAPGSPDPPRCSDPGRIIEHFGTIRHSSRGSDGHCRLDDQSPQKLAGGRVGTIRSPGSGCSHPGRVAPISPASPACTICAVDWCLAVDQGHGDAAPRPP
jgi:hypothetical protein